MPMPRKNTYPKNITKALKKNIVKTKDRVKKFLTDAYRASRDDYIKTRMDLDRELDQYRKKKKYKRSLKKRTHGGKPQKYDPRIRMWVDDIKVSKMKKSRKK